MAIGTATAIGLGLKGLGGLYQTIKGASMDADRPEYKIPEQYKQNVTLAERQAMEGMPSEQKTAFIEEAQRLSQQQLDASKGRKAGSIGIMAAGQTEQRALSDMLTKSAQMKVQNRQRLMQARTQMAKQKEKKFGIARKDAIAKEREKQALIGSGIQNLMGTVDQGLSYEASERRNEAMRSKYDIGQGQSSGTAGSTPDPSSGGTGGGNIPDYLRNTLYNR